MINPSIYGGIPLPKHEDYVAAIAQTIETERIDSYAGMARAMDRVGANDETYKRFVGLMAHVGMLIEPIDQTTKEFVDDEQKAAESVTLGSALGGLIVSKVHGSIAALDKFEINLPKKIWESDGNLDARHTLAEYLSRYGNYGFVIMGDQAEDMLERTESLIVEDVTKQRMFRIGCGIVVHALFETHIRYNQRIAEEDRRQLTEQLDGSTDIDWDSGLHNLLTTRDE